jgi:SAM-dependent methyltransferase
LFESQDYRYGVDDQRYGVLRCRSCGLGYLNPRPSRAAIGHYYPDRYYRHRDDVSQRGRLTAQARYLADLPPGRMLDIGCAEGDFLAMMQGRGWTVVGVEPFSQTAVGKSFEVVADLRDPQLEANSFDAITAWSVIEHMHDPMEAFTRARELLRPNGRVVIHVPNLRSIFSRWSYREDVPRHLHFFTEKTLRKYGDCSGLRLLRVVHDTQIMDGSGRGFLKLRLYRALGRGIGEFFDWDRLPRSARARGQPWMFLLSQPLTVVERLMCSAFIRRALRVNGYVVAIFTRDG